MCIPQINTTLLGAMVITALLAGGTGKAQAHCDTLDGPVVAAARRALAETNVSLALVWVKKTDEGELTEAFKKTLAVRKLNAAARDLADFYFFETLVRIHRAGEGAPYTGLKPAGGDLGPAIPAADKATQDGNLEPVARLLTGEVHDGLRKRFEEIQARKNYPKDDVQAGREYVKAYVEFVHFVEGVHAAAKGPTGNNSHHETEPDPHQHK